MTEGLVTTKPTVQEWDLICFVEEFWYEHKSFPSYEEIKKNVAGLHTPSEIDNVLYSAIVRKYLTNRGIEYFKPADPKDNSTPVGNASRLTDKQLAVAHTLLNPFDKRSTTKKLTDLGVTQATVNGWMKQKRFSDYMRARSEELFGDAMPIAHQALIDKVSSGDVRAIKLFYEISGRYTGVNKEEVVNLKLLLARLLEVLQRHLNPDQLRVIATELNTITSPIIGKQNSILGGEIVSEGQDLQL